MRDPKRFAVTVNCTHVSNAAFVVSSRAHFNSQAVQRAPAMSHVIEKKSEIFIEILNICKYLMCIVFNRFFYILIIFLIYCFYLLVCLYFSLFIFCLFALCVFFFFVSFTVKPVFFFFFLLLFFFFFFLFFYISLI